MEICGSALQLDLRDDPKMKCLIYKSIAYFLPNDLEIVRICALSIFFIEHTLESYYTVEHLYKCADEEYNEQASSVQNRVRFELLPILKKGLNFDPEFWNFSMIKQNCLALLKDKVSVGLSESTLERSSTNAQKPRRALRGSHACIANVNHGGLGLEDHSGAQSKCHGNSKKNHVTNSPPKIDHNVPRHRCVLCNKEFLGGHIVRHAQAHQKKGSFSCVMCRRRFRQKGVMLKHLKNHIKKIRYHLAATYQNQEIPDANEVHPPDPDELHENGKLESSADSKIETVVPSTDQEVQNSELPVDVIENHVSNQDNIVENGSCDSSSNNTPEPDAAEGLPESDSSLGKELPVLHKVNGVLCPQNDLDVMDQAGNFKCPANGCVRVFKKIRFLNKHARKAHPMDLKVQEHIMKWNKGKCRFCQRKFLDSQHFIDHLNKHVYPNVYFCLHFNCNQRFKLSTELLEHTKSHSDFKAQCNFEECCQLFEDLSSLYEHEAQHYSNKMDPSQVHEENSSVTVLESHSSIQEKGESNTEQEVVVDLPVPTWKARKESIEPKTYIQSEKKLNSLIQNGNESVCGGTTTVVNLIDQNIPAVEPNSESCSVGDQLVNGHSEEQASSTSSNTPWERVTDTTCTENGCILPVLQNCNDTPPNDLATVFQSPKPNQTTQGTSYGLISTKPYVRPLPPSYLDERYISMPKRRKMLTEKIDAHAEQDKTCSKLERLRCSKCLTTYCNSEALQLHLAQKKCQTLFGFDSDDESKSYDAAIFIHVILNIRKASLRSCHTKVKNRCGIHGVGRGAVD